jgi:hypothetical protein
MKTRKWPLLLMAILTVLSMSSCQDWGEADPPAGNQKLPAKPDTSAKLIAEFTFDEDFNSTATEGETPVSGEGFAYSADQEIPEIVQDVQQAFDALVLRLPALDMPCIITSFLFHREVC